MDYRPRIVDRELDILLGDLPALALEGPKGVGKTATALRRAASTFRLDEAGQREVLAAAPGLIDASPRPVLIDEWPRHPPVWDHVRRCVDDGAGPGSFLLTGSTAPAETPTHSGAGRIVQVRMRPMSLAERGIEEPTVSLGGLLVGDTPRVTGTTGITVRDYVEEILSSGLPGVRASPARSRPTQLRGYLARVVEREFPDQGLRVRRPAVLRAWLAAYAAATATTASYNALSRAAASGEGQKAAKTTTLAYREVLDRLWLLDEVPGWLPTNNRLRRLGQAPKHHLADPAFAAHLLGVDTDALLQGRSIGPDIPRDGSLLGALFESLVTLSVEVYAQANGATVHHLRTGNGDHEVDLIVELPNQKVVALEVKLNATPESRDVTHLLWLRSQIGPDLLDAAVITAGPNAYRRADGVAVVPAALLGP
jgi:predicted AAA+ superfamily ATPase